MAGFTTQIKARYKAKFPKANLSAAKLDSIVARVDAKTEADDQDAIDAALDAINEYTPFEEMAREEDKIRDLEAKVKKSPAKKVETTTDEPAKEDEEAPAWFKSYVEKTDAKIAAIEGEKTVTSRKQQLADKLKDAPEQFRNDVLTDIEEINFKDDDHFNSYVDRKVAAAAGIIQANSDSGLGKDKPASGFGKAAGDKEMSPEMKERIADRKAAAEAKTAQTA